MMKVRCVHLFMQAVIGLMAVGCLAQHRYPEAKITLHVVNQDGQPVSDTEIEACFWLNDEDIRVFRKRPDKQGMVSFQSLTLAEVLFDNSRTVGRTVLPDQKYYQTELKYRLQNYDESFKTGKWQPWNPTIEMVLKEKKNRSQCMQRMRKMS